MATVLMESTNSINLSNLVPLIGEKYDRKLKQLIQDLLAQFRKESPDFSVYVDAFYELLQAKVDPPFEVIWVYAALNFRSRNFAEGDALDRISVAKDLFQLVSACSASCNASKSIALLVPVVFEVYKVLLELFGKELNLKREKKAMRELKSLLDVIVGYISVCCSKSSDEEIDSISQTSPLPLKDLVCVWINTNEGFEPLLPLLSREVCCWLCGRESNVDYLAGAVITEAFFLKLCLCFNQAKPSEELEKNLKSWAVSSISSLQNSHFFEILERTMLGTALPLSSILKPEDQILLRKALFDAVLLVEYPFIYLNANLMKSLTLTRLILIHEAVENFSCGDQNRAISYLKAFSASRLPSQIIKWVTRQNNLEEKANATNGSSPRALMKWLLSLEGLGIGIFGDDILKLHAKLGLDISQADQAAANSESKIADDDLFYVDNMGEEGNAHEQEGKPNELASAAFVAAAQSMKVTDNGSRKRKGTAAGKKVKFVKYDLHQSSVTTGTSVVTDSSSGESEVEDPVSDAEE
ncbi:hypothetical protein L6164_005145 [Bauhinia variegata]|uniref:Uncharacterized protein n=1 Tax=Bauhinia variegata TaxID=167791 RepID=A0ACB9PSH9_BAUVA|nr:hypothetical protein L6164_005145 [Bauhinia variegata]